MIRAVPDAATSAATPRRRPHASRDRLTIEALVAVERALDEVDLDDEAATQSRFRALADELGLKAGQLFMPIRVAVTGRTQSPGLFETMRVIGKERCRARLAAAIALLRSHGDEVLSADD